MQIKLTLFALINLICLTSYVSKEKNNIFFEEAYLAYYDDKYYFNFKTLNELYDSFEVFLNNEIIFDYQFIKNVSSIPLEGLNCLENNRVDIYLKRNKLKSHYEFYINLNKDISLDLVDYVSFNDFIDDYTNCISFYDEQYFRVFSHEYEIQGNNKYLNINDFINFTFNDKYDLCESISLVIYNNNLFDNLVYNYGYHFLLKAIKGDSYYLDFYTVNEISKYKNVKYEDNKIYYTKELSQNIIDCKITFNSLFHSDIDLSFEQVIDINSFFLEEGNIYIKTIDQINADAYYYEL